MTKLVDFSWGRPKPQAIKDGGYDGVIRYLSRDTTGKALSAVERDEYFAVGLSIHLVFEDTAQGALGGQAQGLADGKVALSQAQGLGLPKGYGIYYAVDFDANQTQLDGPVHEYEQGFAEALAGYYQCAPYGGFNTINGSGKSWQTLAWSGGKIASNANIYQNGQSDFGGSVDQDEYLINDGWDWKEVSGTPPPSAPVHVSAPAPIQASGPGGSYTVVSGDSLSGIGAKVGADWRAIAQLNNISAPFTIYPNEVLHLPGGAAVSPSNTTIRYTVQSGDTLSAIGAKFGVSYQTIAQLNGIADPNRINVGQVLVISGSASPAPAAPAASHAIYTVVRGDTLSGIGSKTGVNWRSIASLNGINAPFVIYPGQELRLN